MTENGEDLGQNAQKPAPFLKWAGGKRQLLDEIRRYVPADYETYFEPFVGGGAVFFEIQPQRAVINDLNTELILTYQAIQNRPDLLIRHLRTMKNTAEDFEKIRSLDKDRKKFSRLSIYHRAARMIYLNHTCFNGLYRENSKGEFNTPFGKYPNPQIINRRLIKADHCFLSRCHLEINNGDFEAAVETAKAGDFVYFDPPYDQLNPTSFTSYDKEGFGKEEQIRLRDLCGRLDRKGVRFLLSNAATPFMKELYQNYRIEIVKAKRNINAKGDGRKEVDEILVRNDYE
jgi:DNA adenine methylase